MLYLLNALPNAILIPVAGESRVIKGISEDDAISLWRESESRTSAIGHASTADVLSQRGILCDFNRVSVAPEAGDTLLVAAFIPPRRLNEGEFFTEEEILGFDMKYCVIEF